MLRTRRAEIVRALTLGGAGIPIIDGMAHIHSFLFHRLMCQLRQTHWKGAT